jgi:hypothetical protein
MTIPRTDIAVAVYELDTHASSAVRELQFAGFNMKRISIIGKNFQTQQHVVGFLGAGDRAGTVGKLGTFWGCHAMLLCGVAMVFVPAIGHVIIMGPLAATIFGGLRGALFTEALMVIGIPKDSVQRYETALKASKFILVIHGDVRDINRARELLATSGHERFDHHHVCEEAPRHMLA